MNKEDIRRVWLTSDSIWIETVDGLRAHESYADYKRLSEATQSEREQFIMSHFGFHWPNLDEDLSYDGFFSKKPQ